MGAKRRLTLDTAALSSIQRIVNDGGDWRPRDAVPPILVTGATGNTGREVVRQLVERRLPVRVLVRSSASAALFAGQNVEIAIGDVERPETLAEALQGVSRMYLVPAAFANAPAAHGAIARLARRAGVRHIVRLSVLGASPLSPISFVRAHWEADQAVVGSGVATTLLRPGWFMQSLMVFAQQIATTGSIRAPVGSAAVSFIDARDVGLVAARILADGGHEGGVYELTGPEAVSFADVAAALSAAIGQRVHYADAPREELQRYLVSRGMPEWLADDFTQLWIYSAQGRMATLTNALQRVGASRGRTVRQFAREMADAFATDKARSSNGTRSAGLQ